MKQAKAAFDSEDKQKLFKFATSGPLLIENKDNILVHEALKHLAMASISDDPKHWIKQANKYIFQLWK